MYEGSVLGRPRTTQLRVRFTEDDVRRIDRLGLELRKAGRRRLTRAAVIRALVLLHVPVVLEHQDELLELVKADPLKRGRVARLPAVLRMARAVARVA